MSEMVSVIMNELQNTWFVLKHFTIVVHLIKSFEFTHFLKSTLGILLVYCVLGLLWYSNIGSEVDSDSLGRIHISFGKTALRMRLLR